MNIFANDGETVMETLEKAELGGWEIEKTGFSKLGHQLCFRRGEEMIAISDQLSTKERVHTSNILPHDSNHDFESANALLVELKESLINQGIQCSIAASEEDLER